MSKLPIVTGREIITALSKVGFAVIRIKGSHHFLKHSDGRSTVISVHAGENIGPGLLNKIFRDCEIEKEEFIGLL
jgi:predicted RNA binding protein YcfA (HicA-like mRNA interferase family)